MMNQRRGGGECFCFVQPSFPPPPHTIITNFGSVFSEDVYDGRGGQEVRAVMPFLPSPFPLLPRSLPPSSSDPSTRHSHTSDTDCIPRSAFRGGSASRRALRLRTSCT